MKKIAPKRWENIFTDSLCKMNKLLKAEDIELQFILYPFLIYWLCWKYFGISSKFPNIILFFS